MTARIRSITIALDHDIRDDDVQTLVQAIKMMRCVAAVTMHEVTPNEFAFEMQMHPTSLMTDSRYPYTYACDFIRMAGPVGSEGVVLSRSDASQIRQKIAEALDMDDRKLACKLADAELAREADPQALNHQTSRLMAALGYPTRESD